ncbi:MAG: hypothetical protein EOO13_00075 [Chitinophagaceae bacterium]|nr:MAG: hypothetical protein EOO13_00075 [Chitinophagaceae bacterium]
MLSSISWQHYIAAIVIITVSYYLYVVLRYYQKEIANLFNRKSTSTEMFAGLQAAPIEVMGKAKPDIGVMLSEASELQFTEASPDDPEILSDAVPFANGHQPSTELIQEANNLIEAFKDLDNKQEFLSLLGILIDSYKSYSDEIDLPATLDRVITITKEKLQFPVTSSDLPHNWA